MNTLNIILYFVVGLTFVPSVIFLFLATKKNKQIKKGQWSNAEEYKIIYYDRKHFFQLSSFFFTVSALVLVICIEFL